MLLRFGPALSRSAPSDLTALPVEHFGALLVAQSHARDGGQRSVRQGATNFDIDESRLRALTDDGDLCLVSSVAKLALSEPSCRRTIVEQRQSLRHGGVAESLQLEPLPLLPNAVHFEQHASSQQRQSGGHQEQNEERQDDRLPVLPM